MTEEAFASKHGDGAKLARHKEIAAARSALFQGKLELQQILKSQKDSDTKVTPAEIKDLIDKAVAGSKPYVVLIGQVKRYFAYESRHQHGAFDMTGGFKYFLFSSLFGEDSHFD